MKKAFTLVEMLIVVVVLVTLMSIAFRLSSISENQTDRNQTISRMQRLENCLSGYYAAFGTYPPVRLHGSRNIYAKIDNNGMQSVDGEENSAIWGWTEIGQTDEESAWRQVRAACLAQPVACKFPFADDFDTAIDRVSDEMKRKASSSDTKYKKFWSNAAIKQKLTRGFKNFGTSGALGSIDKTTSDWRETQVFQFGVMSFLLPRYSFMIALPTEVWGQISNMKQWTDNNQTQHDPYTGSALTWETIRKYTYDGSAMNNARILSIASQAVCARWMPNLEGICNANSETSFFGIKIGGSENSETALSKMSNNQYIDVYTTESGGNPYILDEITVMDGWDQEFYYYSPAPYQTYTLWSGGHNLRTFPPWIDRSSMSASANRCISKWIVDDIIHMKN